MQDLVYYQYCFLILACTIFTYYVCSYNTDFSENRRNGLRVIGLCTMVFSCIHLLIEIFQIINLDILATVKQNQICIKFTLKNIIFWKYFRSIKNYMDVPLYICSFCFSFLIDNKCLCPSKGLWQVGIVAILFAWINLLLLLKKWSLVGKYITMFEAILVRFMKVSIIALVLVIAFSLAFFMALHEPYLPVS